MTGDPHWQECQCPVGSVQNGTKCVALPTCENGTQVTVEPCDCPEGINVLVFVMSILFGIVCSGYVGYHLAPILKNTTAVAPERHHTNLMYQSADGLVTRS